MTAKQQQQQQQLLLLQQQQQQQQRLADVDTGGFCPIAGIPLPPIGGEGGREGGRPRHFVGQYELLETLGKGMSGKVKKARHVGTGDEVALKIIDKSKAAKRTLQQLRTEIMSLRTLHHPNILELLQVELDALYVKKNGTRVPSIILALQLASGGELFDFMMYTGHFQEHVARTLFAQLADALHYCHKRNIYHRDIKPENLLLDSNFQLKIADFGLAAIRADPLDTLHTECGTRSYMAPEILLHNGYEGGKADVWSMGVVLFILLAGNPPFQLARRGDWWFNALLDNDWERFWKAHQKYAPHLPLAAQAFLSFLFQPDPALRPSSQQLLMHEWMQGPLLTPGQLKLEMMARQGDVLREKDKERAKAKEEKFRQLQEAAAVAAAVSPASLMSMGSGNTTFASLGTTGAGGSLGACLGSQTMYKEQLTRHRSVYGEEEEKDTLALSPASYPEEGPRRQKLAPLLPVERGLKAFTYFYSKSSSSEALLDRLHFLLLGQLSATIKPPQGMGDGGEEALFHVRCLVPLTAAKVCLDIRIWRVVEEGGKEEGDEEEGEKVVLHVIEAKRKEGDPVLFHRVYRTIKTKMLQEEEEEEGKGQGVWDGSTCYGSQVLPVILPATPSPERAQYSKPVLVPPEQEGSEGVDKKEEIRGEEEEEVLPRPQALHEEQMSDVVEMI